MDLGIKLSEKGSIRDKIADFVPVKLRVLNNDDNSLLVGCGVLLPLTVELAHSFSNDCP